MHSRHKRTGRALPVPAGLALGAVMALTLTLVSSIALGKCMENNKISEGNIGYWVMIQLFTITLFSALLCAEKVKHQKIVLCAASGVVYWGILMSITALFFGGQYEAVWETTAVIAVGSVCAAGICILKERAGSKKRKAILHH